MYPTLNQGSTQNRFLEILGMGGGGSANPKFLSFFSKTKFALELSINVMEIEEKNDMLRSRGRPAGSQWVKGLVKGSKGVKEWAYMVPGSQGIGLLGPKGSRGRPTECQGVKREG